MTPGAVACLFGFHRTTPVVDSLACDRCGRWKEPEARWFWDEWRGSLDGRPVMFIQRLARVPVWYWRGKVYSVRLDRHMFTRADDADCFHTHPAWAIRIPYSGGYVEEIFGPGQPRDFRHWFPFDIGIVYPKLAHRVARIMGATGVSLSLWLRGPICADVQLLGSGWPNRTAPERN